MQAKLVRHVCCYSSAYLTLLLPHWRDDRVASLLSLLAGWGAADDAVQQEGGGAQAYLQLLTALVHGVTRGEGGAAGGGAADGSAGSSLPPALAELLAAACSSIPATVAALEVDARQAVSAKQQGRKSKQPSPAQAEEAVRWGGSRMLQSALLLCSAASLCRHPARFLTDAPAACSPPLAGPRCRLASLQTPSPPWEAWPPSSLSCCSTTTATACRCWSACCRLSCSLPGCRLPSSAPWRSWGACCSTGEPTSAESAGCMFCACSAVQGCSSDMSTCQDVLLAMHRRHVLGCGLHASLTGVLSGGRACDVQLLQLVSTAKAALRCAQVAAASGLEPAGAEPGAEELQRFASASVLWRPDGGGSGSNAELLWQLVMMRSPSSPAARKACDVLQCLLGQPALAGAAVAASQVAVVAADLEAALVAPYSSHMAAPSPFCLVRLQGQ